MINLRKKGTTLVELMMVIAIVSIVFTGIIMLIQKVSKGTWLQSGALDLTRNANDAMYWIEHDFINAKASSMGNQAQNPGFEDPLISWQDPYCWNALSTANAIKLGPGGDRIKSGFYSVGVPPANNYESLVGTTTYTTAAAGTRNYILSGWVKNENRGLGELRMVTQAGADFAPAVFVSSTTTSNPGWDHITTTTNQLVNINFKFRLTHTGGDFWSKIMTNAIGSGGRDYGYNYGYNGGTGTGTLGAYKGFLYEAMTDPGASSYAVYYDGAIWNTAQTSGLGAETPNYIYNMAPGMKAEYNGMIYAFRNPGLAGNVYALKCFNGSNWSTVNSLAFYQGTALEQSSSVNCYAVFQGNLYMGGWWKGTPEQAIWQYDGTNVNRVYYVAGGGTRVTDLCVYGTRIYALTNWIPGSQVIASVDGLNWVPDANFTLLCVGTFAAGSWATKMVSYNGKLYVGVNGVYPGFMSRLFVYDGVSWSAPAAAVLSEDANITALYVDNGILYIGTSGQDGGRIYTWNGAAINPSYTLFGSSFFKTINSIISYNSLLLANYNQWNPGPVGETGILQWGGYTLFDDVSLSPAQVVFSSSTAVSTDTTYEYYTNYGTSETDLNKYRKYRLRYDRPNRKLYRERWTGPNPTDYALDGPDPLCANVVNLTIINRNQESFLVRLVLEKPVGEGKTKLYRVENECAPRVP